MYEEVTNFLNFSLFVPLCIAEKFEIYRCEMKTYGGGYNIYIQHISYTFKNEFFVCFRKRKRRGEEILKTYLLL